MSKNKTISSPTLTQALRAYRKARKALLGVKKERPAGETKGQDPCRTVCHAPGGGDAQANGEKK